jgi:putative peptide zinc metalloprotease protein
VLGILTWVLFPLGKMLHFLTTAPALDRVRGRALGFVFGGLAVLLGLLAVVPVPDTFTVPGVVRAGGHQRVFAASTGEMVEILTPGGSRVVAGQPLIRLANPDLELELRALAAEFEEARALEHQSLATTGEGLGAIRQRLSAVLARQQEIRRLAEDLIIRAPADGIWVAPDLSSLRGAWVKRGTSIGELVPEGEIEFQAVVGQSDADRLFDQRLTVDGVRLPGQADDRVPVSALKVIESRQEILPSAAMGWQAGGDIATRGDDQSGRRSAEPFFEVRATLDAAATDRLWHGRSGKLRCRLPASPLLGQWSRRLRQAFQSHGAGG